MWTMTLRWGVMRSILNWTRLERECKALARVWRRLNGNVRRWTTTVSWRRIASRCRGASYLACLYRRKEGTTSAHHGQHHVWKYPHGHVGDAGTREHRAGRDGTRRPGWNRSS